MKYLGIICGFVLLICLLFFTHSRFEADAAKARSADDAAALELTTPHKVRPIDRWSITTNTNELDGKKKLALNNGQVFIRCVPVVEGYILPPLHNLGGRLEPNELHSQIVRYRLDDGVVHKEQWAISDDFEALFMSRNTLKQLSHAQKMILEYEPEYITPQTTTITLEGLAEAETKAGCKL